MLVSTIPSNHARNIHLKPKPKLTFRLPHRQEYLDVDGEYHGRDDDGGERRRGDVGKVGGQEGAGGLTKKLIIFILIYLSISVHMSAYQYDRPRDDPSQGRPHPGVSVDCAAPEGGRHGHRTEEGAGKLKKGNFPDKNLPI